MTPQKSDKPLKLRRKQISASETPNHFNNIITRLGLHPKPSREVVLEQANVHASDEDGHTVYDSATEQEIIPSKVSDSMDDGLALVNSSDVIVDIRKSDDELVSDDTENALNDEEKEEANDETATVPLPTSWKQDRHLKRNRFGGTRKIVVPGSEDEFLLSDCQGRRKALFVGCNYMGQSNELKGCINDCHNMAAFIMSRYGFQDDNILMLTDEQDDPDYLPTAEHIISGMYWLVYDAMPGDSLFFHFSGHGISVVDEDGDEADGFDEAICPMDYKESGVIVDDMLHDILVRPLQPGVRLTAVFDCCHSGTALDLPYVYQCDGEIQLCAESYRGAAAKAFVEMARGLKERNAVYAVGQLMEGLKLLRKKGDNKDAQRKTEQTKTSLADVIMFSGCRDDQTAADLHEMEQATGALSTALIATLSENREQTYTELLKNLRRRMKGQFTQIPQLSTGHPMDMNITFMM